MYALKKMSINIHPFIHLNLKLELKTKSYKIKGTIFLNDDKIFEFYTHCKSFFFLLTKMNDKINKS
jgi:hypothetical protein